MHFHFQPNIHTHVFLKGCLRAVNESSELQKEEEVHLKPKIIIVLLWMIQNIPEFRDIQHNRIVLALQLTELTDESERRG